MPEQFSFNYEEIKRVDDDGRGFFAPEDVDPSATARGMPKLQEKVLSGTYIPASHGEADDFATALTTGDDFSY